MNDINNIGCGRNMLSFLACGVEDIDLKGLNYSADRAVAPALILAEPAPAITEPTPAITQKTFLSAPMLVATEPVLAQVTTAPLPPRIDTSSRLAAEAEAAAQAAAAAAAQVQADATAKAQADAAERQRLAAVAAEREAARIAAEKAAEDARKKTGGGGNYGGGSGSPDPTTEPVLAGGTPITPKKESNALFLGVGAVIIAIILYSFFKEK